ncbi:MAG TPA: hypothetical protein VK928_11570 [Longimicrobiales bacterium]|nr:hypothetical protein [Longimicrobiales bacterium]
MERVATYRVLGDVQRVSGRHGEALGSYDAALRTVRDVMGDVHRDIPILLARRATVLEAMGDTAGAVADYSAVVAAAEAAHGASHARTLEARMALAEYRVRTGQPPDDAELDGIAAGAASLEGALAEALRTRVDSARARLVRSPR